MRLPIIAALLLASTPALAAPIDDRAAVALAKPQVLIVDKSLSLATVAAMLRPVRTFYGFWNNGSQALLDQAISPTFTDRTRPPDRPQGPKGSMVAMRGFQGAVPDLRCTIVQWLVVGDRVVSHERFTGHFTGTFSSAAEATNSRHQLHRSSCQRQVSDLATVMAVHAATGRFADRADTG